MQKILKTIIMSTIIEGIDLAVKVAEKLENCRKEQEADLTLNVEKDGQREIELSLINQGECDATDIVIAFVNTKEEGSYFWDSTDNQELQISFLAKKSRRKIIFFDNEFGETIMTFEIRWKDKRKGIQTKSITLDFVYN